MRIKLSYLLTKYMSTFFFLSIKPNFWGRKKGWCLFYIINIVRSWVTKSTILFLFLYNLVFPEVDKHSFYICLLFYVSIIKNPFNIIGPIRFKRVKERSFSTVQGAHPDNCLARNVPIINIHLYFASAGTEHRKRLTVPPRWQMGDLVRFFHQ